MPFHDVTASSCPPASGARIGASPVTSISDENSRTAAAPECRSRTTAREITIPPAPASPWTKRRAISAPTLVAAAHSSDATA